MTVAATGGILVFTLPHKQKVRLSFSLDKRTVQTTLDKKMVPGNRVELLTQGFSVPRSTY